MAEKQNSASDAELKMVALELFKSSRVNGLDSQRIALRCFKDAASFLEVAEDVLTGGVNLHEVDSNPLDEAFAPNLKKTHPINLMSREWGNLDKVRSALEMVRNPEIESFEDYNWGKPECNQARALFPAVIARADKLEKLAKLAK